MELAIHVKDLAETWLKDCPNRSDVVDVVVKEQFVEVLPEEVRVWVNLGLLRRLLDWLDYKLWMPVPKSGCRRGVLVQRSCYACGVHFLEPQALTTVLLWVAMFVCT